MEGNWNSVIDGVEKFPPCETVDRWIRSRLTRAIHFYSQGSTAICCHRQRGNTFRPLALSAAQSFHYLCLLLRAKFTTDAVNSRCSLHPRLTYPVQFYRLPCNVIYRRRYQRRIASGSIRFIPQKFVATISYSLECRSRWNTYSR